MARQQALLGQGIATQAATIARDAAVSRLGVSRLVALVHRDHVASRRVAQKIGMHEERTTLLEADYPAVVYATDLPDRNTPSRDRCLGETAAARKRGN